VINAAAVRGFDPNEGRRAPLPVRRSDVWLLALLLGCTGVLVAARMW
jgi:energy-coupling factor transporter transmembrane protein EcfT